MNLAKVSRFLAASLLLLTLLGDTTEACKCSYPHPQKAFCSSDIVLRAKFLDILEEPQEERMGFQHYAIKTTKLYKGPEEMKDVRYVYTTWPCKYVQMGVFNKDYIITGSLYEDIVTIGSCNFIRPWAWLTLAQRRGFTSKYRKGCSCSIVECHSECSITSDQCLLADSRTQENLHDFQFKHVACLPQVEKNGMCTWKSLDT